jgi:hypothetical protein
MLGNVQSLQLEHRKREPKLAICIRFPISNTEYKDHKEVRLLETTEILSKQRHHKPDRPS